MVGAVVGKAQNLKAPVNGVADVVLLPPGGMVAPPGMGMIICDHDLSPRIYIIYSIIAKRKRGVN